MKRRIVKRKKRARKRGAERKGIERKVQVQTANKSLLETKATAAAAGAHMQGKGETSYDEARVSSCSLKGRENPDHALGERFELLQDEYDPHHPHVFDDIFHTKILQSSSSSSNSSSSSSSSIVAAAATTTTTTTTTTIATGRKSCMQDQLSVASPAPSLDGGTRVTFQLNTLCGSRIKARSTLSSGSSNRSQMTC